MQTEMHRLDFYSDIKITPIILTLYSWAMEVGLCAENVEKCRFEGNLKGHVMDSPCGGGMREENSERNHSLRTDS